MNETICTLIEWNKPIRSSDDYYATQHGMQLLAASCTLLTAVGEGVNRINRLLPDFLGNNFPEIPWHAIVGMRNHIAHGYFELDAEIIFDAVKTEITELKATTESALQLCRDFLASY